MTKRTVNKAIFSEWFEAKYPDALTKLARATKIPATSLIKIRSGRVPRGDERRELLAEALGVSVDDLFPVSNTKKKAS